MILATERGQCRVDGVEAPQFDFHIGLTWSVENLATALAPYDAVVFADPCKPAQCPLMRVVSELQETGTLPRRWRLAAAQPTRPARPRTSLLSADDVETGGECSHLVAAVRLTILRLS